MSNISIAILAGGGSRRMGENKALLQWNGKPLLQRIITTANTISDSVFIVGNPNEYEQFGKPCIPDVYPDHGPLGGIYTALKHASTDRVLVLGCDMPLLTSPYLHYLIQNAVDCDAAISFHNERLHPLAAVYHQNCLPVFEEQLTNKRLRLLDAVEAVHYKPIPVHDGLDCYHSDLFFNVNTPENYALLLQKSS